MAVWAYFAFDGTVIDTTTTPPKRADWVWAMQQWDMVAAAGSAVRLVVVDGTYGRFDATPENQGKRAQVQTKFDACSQAGQLLFGRVYVAGGRLPLGSVGLNVPDPMHAGVLVPSVADQINSWADTFGGALDGIYVDSGPSLCTDPGSPDGVPEIRENYRAYMAKIEEMGYHSCISAPQHADAPTADHPQGWLRELEPDLVSIWEGGTLPYQSRFEAKDPCRPGTSPGVPGWWDPGEGRRWSRVHVITDCAEEARMRTLVDLAVRKRNAGTIFVTQFRRDLVRGAVFDVLPPYWEAEVELFREFARRDEEAKESKDSKDEKEASDDKQAKDEKDGKDEKETKEAKDEKEAKESADEKQAKDEKDGKDEKETKDAKDELKETKEKEDKEEKEKETEVTEKDIRDEAEKARKDEKDDFFHGPEFLKDSEANMKTFEMADPGSFRDLADPSIGDLPVEPDLQSGRGDASTFIRSDERPEVGGRLVADQADDGADEADPATPDADRDQGGPS